MPDARRRLENLRIREIALCRRGIHPGAQIMLYKAADDADDVELGKVDDEPKSFTEHLESARVQEIDSALDRRLHALLATTTEIMRADVDDREARVLDAVDAYAATMKRDVPDLFAGRIVKQLRDWAADGLPSDDDVHAVVKAELAEAGLLPDAPASGGENMDFLKALTERGQAALKYVLGDRDPAEFFKGVSEDAGKLVVGLLEKAAEHGPELEAVQAELEKAKQPPVEPNSIESILKAVEDQPGVAAFIKAQDAGLRKVSGDFHDYRKEARHKELVGIAKGYDCLPDADGVLLEALEKADEAGILEPIQKALDVGQRGAKLGKAMEELGIDSIPGETGGVMSPEEADQALVAKATEIQKADVNLSAERAYELACERNPQLYQATRKVHQAAH